MSREDDAIEALGKVADAQRAYVASARWAVCVSATALIVALGALYYAFSYTHTHTGIIK